jgi:hypothetical protein
MSLQRFVVFFAAIISYTFTQLNSLLESYTGTRELPAYRNPCMDSQARGGYILCTK